MDVFSAYIPTDRRFALAAKSALSERSDGCALFADISGFTPLTEVLARALGARRGAEELTVHLNSVYQALIQEVDQYGGSVIAFAGDAITCWFDGDDSRRSILCALAIQGTMAQFAKVELAHGETVSLAVKIGIAQGPVRRLLVGDPDIQLLDVLAGRTLLRMAAAAHLAQRGETVVPRELAQYFGKDLQAKEFRPHPDTGEPFVVVGGLAGRKSVQSWPRSPQLSENQVRPWLLRPVYDRLRTGQGEFLTELRPAVAMFARFEGIDYDLDAEAGVKLSGYVSWIQRVMARYDGFLIDLAVGDKGSYLYGCFGAPIAHENDAWRAVTAAHEIASPQKELAFITGTHVGLSGGTMRTGAYGGTSRRTYGVLGDEVNLAARLMESAGHGQVLVSERLRRITGDLFEWQELPPLKAKGKAEPVKVLRLLGPAQKSASRLSGAQYGLDLVGRTRELERIKESLGKVVHGQAQVLCLSAEAGMGKSRLVAETVRLAEHFGLKSYMGECQAHGTHTSYLAWQNIWQGLMGIDSKKPIQKQIDTVRECLSEINPMLTVRLPLLATILNLPIPDNEVTAPLDARLRKGSLESLLLECLRAKARVSPLLLVLEDTHWIDALSRDLLDLVRRSVAQERIFLLFTRRPPETGQTQAPGFEHLPYFCELSLTAFTDDEANRLIQLKLAQLFNFSGAAPVLLASRLMARSAGNPFYLEELLNFVRDEKVDFQDAKAIENLELPASLHSLVLSRIDRLTDTEQSALKVASVVGRLFPAAVVCGIQSERDRRQIASDLQRLCQTDLTAIDRPEPELTYLFKHVVTQEVAYESLPHATRSKLHNQIGLCLESLCGERLEQQVNLLAFHFDRSQNLDKKRQYLSLAGEAAQANYANAAAISYYERALPVVDQADKVAILLKLGKVRELTGEWKNAGACYQLAFEAAEAVKDHLSKARSQAAMGDLLRKQGLFADATNWLSVARTAFEEIGDPTGVGQALHAMGTVAAMQGNYPQARTFYEQSLEMRRQLGEQAQIASLLSNLGIIARFSADYPQARQLMEQSLEIRREVGDRWAVANSLNNLGVLLRDIEELSQARALLEESLGLNRQVGDRWAIANTLSSLGEVTIDQKDWEAAQLFLGESLKINMELGDRTAVAFVLECFAGMAASQNDGGRALRLAGAAASLRAAIGSPLSPAEQQRLDLNLEKIRRSLPPGDVQALYEQGKNMALEQAIAATMPA